MPGLGAEPSAGDHAAVLSRLKFTVAFSSLVLAGGRLDSCWQQLLPAQLLTPSSCPQVRS